MTICDRCRKPNVNLQEYTMSITKEISNGEIDAISEKVIELCDKCFVLFEDEVRGLLYNFINPPQAKEDFLKHVNLK